jgi:hypothetical protein
MRVCLAAVNLGTFLLAIGVDGKKSTSTTENVQDEAAPTTPYGPDWQACTSSSPCLVASSTDGPTDFKVSTSSLPKISFALPNSYAGLVSVNRPNHPDDQLFFWAFESSQGSLSASAGQQAGKPWGVWLNGGCVVLSISSDTVVNRKSYQAWLLLHERSVQREWSIQGRVGEYSTVEPIRLVWTRRHVLGGSTCVSVLPTVTLLSPT